MKKRNPTFFSRKTKGELVYNGIIIIFLGLAAIMTLYPFLNVISTSFSSNNAINTGKVSWHPVGFNLDSYKSVIADGQIIASFKNSVVITFVGTALNMIFTILAAYPLSRKRFMGRSFFLKMITVTMVFSGGIIPTYLLVQKLGMLNSYLSIWLPGLIGTFNMFVLKTNFEGIPDAIEEAAAIDGANDAYILVKIILPISLPTLATLTLFYAVGLWNSYMNVIMYISDSKKHNMTAKLMQMISTMNDNILSGDDLQATRLTEEGVKATSIVLTTLPILILYPFLQKYFVNGVIIGSVKG